jgi:hypothetical protein
MKRCRTCGIPLWMAWQLFGWPWERRVKRYRDAVNCTDLLTVKDAKQLGGRKR